VGRALAAVLLAAGCGRVAFDPLLDAAIDAAPPSGFATLCGFTSLTVIHCGNVSADSDGDMIQAAIATQCAAGQAERTVLQTDPAILNQTTHQPLLAANDLAVAGGGELVENINAYYRAQNAWPVILTGSTTYTWTERATGQVLATGPYSGITATHDYGLVMLLRDPNGVSSVMTGFGFGAPGSLVAVYFFQTVIAPAIASDRHTWYLLEWTNGDADINPSAGDTFSVLGSG
jgi:hypothetical protein